MRKLGAAVVGVQVLIVRYLSKAEFGAFAYTLSIVLFTTTVITLGLDRAVTRFIPIYHEQGAYDRFSAKTTVPDEWKQTPEVRKLVVEFVAPTTVLNQE